MSFVHIFDLKDIHYIIYNICYSNLVKIFVPAGKIAKPGSEICRGLIAVVALERGRVRVCHGDIAWLHRDELFVRLEVVIVRQNSRGDKLLLENVDEVEQVFGVLVAYIVDRIRRNGQTVFAVLALRCALHDAHNALDYIVDVCEVALAVAVVENADCLAAQKLVGEAEIRHVRAACGSVDREEAESRRGDIIELRIGVSHQLVGFFRCGVEADGVVNFVVGAVGHFLLLP